MGNIYVQIVISADQIHVKAYHLNACRNAECDIISNNYVSLYVHVSQDYGELMAMVML